MSDIRGTIQGKSVTGKVQIGNIYKGFSPIATVEENEEGVVVTITDKKGTTTAMVRNGKDGYTPQKGTDYFDGESGKPGTNGRTAYDYATAAGYSKTELEFANDLSQVGNSYSKDEIDAMIAEITYKEIAINTFSNNVGTAEIGSTVNAVTLTWGLNKQAKALTIDGTAQDTATTSKALANLGLTANKTWTLKATDEKGAEATKTTTLSFLNGAYYGIGSTGTYNSEFILGLTKTLTSTKARTITVTAGEGQYIYYCVPSRFGACSFNVGGFDGGFELADTIQFTNASDYTEEYYVYKSSNAGLGSTTVKVS